MDNRFTPEEIAVLLKAPLGSLPRSEARALAFRAPTSPRRTDPAPVAAFQSSI